MKVCFIGMGSIGQRHLRNFISRMDLKNKKYQIHIYKSSPITLSDEIIRKADKLIHFPENLDYDYDVTFITNPTKLHFETIEMMAERTQHMFIEKPLFSSIDVSPELLALHSKRIYYVAGPLRYSDVYLGMKALLGVESVFSVRAICSSYLPDWRSGTDYRSSYSANAFMGGGVRLDLIHEWDYVASLWGFPEACSCFYGKFSNLDINSEDVAVYIAKYPHMMLEMHLDYFGKKRERLLQIYVETGMIQGDFIQNRITFSDGRTPIIYPAGNDEMYKREMEAFLNAVEHENDSFSNIDLAYRVLQVALGGAN